MSLGFTDEAKKLFYKLIKDGINKTVKGLTNKTITDVESDNSESSSLLPMLPPSNEEQQSRV
jgi:hypothetical protein